MSCFTLCLTFSLSKSILNYNKMKKFFQYLINSLQSLFWPRRFLVLFSVPVSLKEGSERVPELLFGY